jgi:hypothetical protein
MPALAPATPRRLDFFFRSDIDAHLYQYRRIGDHILSRSVADIAGGLSSGAAACVISSVGNPQVHLAFRGADRKLWTMHAAVDPHAPVPTQEVWGLLRSIDSPHSKVVLSAPALVSVQNVVSSESQLYAFVVGFDHHLWCKALIGAFDWQAVGGLPGHGLYSTPTAVSHGPGLVDVFARTDTGGLAHFRLESTLADLATGKLTLLGSGTLRHAPPGRESLLLWSSPAAVSWGPGRIDVFALAAPGAELGDPPPFDPVLRHWWFERGWPPASPEDFGIRDESILIPSLAVTSPGDHQLAVYVAGGLDGLIRIRYDTDHWTPWEPVLASHFFYGSG